MSAGRLERIREVFLLAWAIPAEWREAVLARECGGDAGMRREVEELLAAEENAGFLETVQMPTPPRATEVGGAPVSAAPAVDGYTVLSLLGHGGMGTVWKAIQASTNRPVAIKLMNAAALDSDRARARFAREVELAARLQHHNIARIYDSGLRQGVYFYAMELVEGRPLDAFVRERKLSEGQVLAVMRRVCRGLQHAHLKGVIHRDLKPSNILVDKQGQPLILDFGIAKAVSGDDLQTLTREGEVAGTPAYMSPEQVRGAVVDARSDIFSFGVVLYESLTGRLPFRRGSNAEMMAAILRDEPAPVEASPRVAAIVRRCLRKSPAERYQSMGQIRAALKEASSVSVETGASVAILPFANTGGDAGDEYFADGLAEEIINALTRVGGLRVIARTSAFAFKGKNEDIRGIAKTLGVDHVLEGSVRRAGNRLRIMAQLIAASNGAHVWSHRYDREMVDVFAIQDEIAAAITEELRGSLAPSARRAGHVPKLAAYEALLQARHHWHKFSSAGLERALVCFQEALSIDPDYPAAHSGLASYYGTVASLAKGDSTEMLGKARAAAAKALGLDPTLPEAHAMLGVVSGVVDYDWARAANHFERALELDRLAPAVCIPYAIWHLRPRGRLEEAMGELNRLRERDPLSVMARAETSLILFLMRDYEGSALMARQALDLEPGNKLGELQLVRAWIALKRYDEAVALAERSTQDRRWFVALAHLAAAYGAVGRGDEARKVLAEMHEQAAESGQAHATPFATTYAALGDIETAVQWVEEAIRLREPMITTLKMWPVFDPIRSHPRYPALLQMMNLQ
jgi:serine/threonine-protein kinase